MEVLVDNIPTGKMLKLRLRDFGGQGKPIALLHHANGFCAGTWQLVASQLISHFHVVAIDARGHGESDGGEVPRDYDWQFFVDDLVAVANQICEEYKVSQIDYGVGSSFGGIITAAAEASQPGLFRRLAMFDPPIFPTDKLIKKHGLSFSTENSTQATLVAQTLKRRRTWSGLDEPREAWRNKGMFVGWSDSAFELYLAECLAVADDGSVSLKCDPSVEAHIFETTGSLDVSDYAHKVKAPLLYIRASEGHFSAEFCRVVAKLFPMGRYEEMSGGHLLPLEVPDRVANCLLKN